MKELTFKEVIANIKEGEVWESNCKIIKYEYGQIIAKNKGYSKCDSFVFDDRIIYRLQRKEYTFQEAFKSYEEGKEIESKESGYKYKEINNKLCTFSTTFGGWILSGNDGFELREIKGKWYIND